MSERSRLRLVVLQVLVLSLFVTLGAATDPETPRESVIEGFWLGLSKRSLQVA